MFVIARHCLNFGVVTYFDVGFAALNSGVSNFGVLMFEFGWVMIHVDNFVEHCGMLTTSDPCVIASMLWA